MSANRQTQRATIPPPATTDELQSLAAVIVRAMGAVVQHWDNINLAPGHPYRHAWNMIRCYLCRRYNLS
jgi:hypothetical protein